MGSSILITMRNKIPAAASGVALVLFATSFVGCRAGIKVSTANARTGATDAPPSSEAPAASPEATSPSTAAKKTSTATPIEIADGFSATRLYYQTRSVITLNIKATAVVSGDLISLHNDTTGLDLFDHQPLAFGLTAADEPADVLSLDGAPYDIQIRLYPAATEFAGRFGYSVNKLRLIVNDAAQPKFSQSQIYLKDFPYFSAGSTNFSGSGQRTDGLQGGVSRLVSPSVTNGTATITTGMVNILNR